jgi:hypothetical protein
MMNINEFVPNLHIAEGRQVENLLEAMVVLNQLRQSALKEKKHSETTTVVVTILLCGKMVLVSKLKINSPSFVVLRTFEKLISVLFVLCLLGTPIVLVKSDFVYSRD